MSKKCKLKNREKRLQEKRSRKAANKARYAELKRLGINSKSKRFKTGQSKKRKISSEDHPNGNCGNVGCKKCFPDLYQLTVEYRKKLKYEITCQTKV
jgi:hypothetical protein